MIDSPIPMTNPNSIPASGAAPLCRFVERLDVAALRRLLDRASTGELLWNHAQQCPLCRRLLVELPAENGPGNSVALFFLETGVEDGDRLFERGGCRFGVSLRSEKGCQRVLRLVRDFAPPPEDRRPAAIHLLRLDRESDGETLRGEIPVGIEEILLEGHPFRQNYDGCFRRAEQ